MVFSMAIGGAIRDKRSAFGERIVSWSGAALVAAFLPVCLTLARGGADWHVFPDRPFSWYASGHGAAWPGLAASLFIVFVRPRGSPPWQAVFGAGLAGIGCGAWVLWSGGGRLGPLSLHHADPGVWLGAGLLLLSAVGGIHLSARPKSALGRLLCGLALGGLLMGLLLDRDRRVMEQSLEPDSSALSASLLRASAAARRPDVVWIVADTLRADSLGSARRDRPGHPRAGPPAGAALVPPTPTPTLDRLASRGVLFEHAVAPAPWTLPSMSSLLTGRHPSTLDPIGRGEATDLDGLPRLDPQVPTWIGRLRSIGYRTVGFQKNPFLGPGSGIEQSFDLYRMVGGDRAEQQSGAQLVRAALRWASVYSRGRAAGRTDPYLLYVHFMDPHIDYRAPARFRSVRALDYRGTVDGTARDLHARLAAHAAPVGEDRAQLRRLYAAEVAYLDAQVGSLLQGLQDRELLDESTLVVFGSDHGEQFGEHGSWEHGDLHAENVRVPWIMAGAGLAPRRVATPIAAMDLGPTILGLLGAPSLPGVKGRDQTARLREGRSPGEDGETGPIVTEYGAAIRWQEPPFVLIENADGQSELYDLVEDPEERRNLVPECPDLAEAMRARVVAHQSRFTQTQMEMSPASERKLDARTLEALRALGYDGESR